MGSAAGWMPREGRCTAPSRMSWGTMRRTVLEGMAKLRPAEAPAARGEGRRRGLGPGRWESEQHANRPQHQRKLLREVPARQAPWLAGLPAQEQPATAQPCCSWPGLTPPGLLPHAPTGVCEDGSVDADHRARHVQQRPAAVPRVHCAPREALPHARSACMKGQPSC